MSMIRVVVEGPTDAALILRLLPDSLASQCDVYLANGKSRLASVARTHLTINPEPVVLVTDADAIDRRKIDEEHRQFQNFVGQVAPEERFRIIFAEPEIEAVFFADVGQLAEWLGIEISEAEAIRAEFVPKTILTQLLQRSNLPVRTSCPELVELLTDDMIEAMRQHPLTKTIETAISELALEVAV